MKKLLSTLIPLSMALCASAGINHDAAAPHLEKPAPSVAPLTSAQGVRSASRASIPGDVKTYSRSSQYFYVMMGVSLSTSENYATDIIWGDNGDVYIKAPLSDENMPTDTYMKGTIENGVMTFNLPQDFAVIDGKKYMLNRLEYKLTNPDEQKGLYFITEDNKITYTLHEDGSVSMEKSSDFSDEIDLPDFILGLTDEEGNWVGYGDFNQTYTPFDGKISTLPEGAEIHKMQVTYDDYAAKVMDMAVKDGKVYIAGFNSNYPEACIVGDIDGNRLSFPTGQYIGTDNYWHSFIYFWAGEYKIAYDPLAGEDRLQLMQTPSLDFAWEGNTLQFATDNMLIVNHGNDQLAYIELFNKAKGKPYDAEAVPAAPMAPVFDIVDEYNPEQYYGYGKVRFLLPMIDVNGNLLDTSKLYYKFFIDGAPYEFKTSDYKELKQNMVEVPWSFTDTDSYGGYDFKSYNITHIVYFYDPSMKMLDHMALQQYYRIDDNNVLASEKTHYGKPSSVKTIPAEEADTEVRWLNMQGMPVDEPANGIFLKVSTSKEGKVTTRKVRVR